MTETGKSHSELLPLTAQIAIDRRCTDFERAIRAGFNPRLEDFLDGFADSARETALEELLALELEHEVQRDDPPSLDEYRRRFPAERQLVKSVYLNSLVPRSIGAFRVDGVLGTGGFGRVYLAYDLNLNRPVAIKMLLGHAVRSQGAVEGLLREARLAAQLRHPSIVRVYQVEHDEDGDPFVVLEYIDGKPLGHPAEDRRLSTLRIVEIVLKVAQALQYAHDNGLTHRDLKPANILLDKNDEPFITDFGLAIDETTERLRAGEFAGTPPYMAPEQVAGESHRVDRRTDIWALGVILYELLTGERPFRGSDREELFYAIRFLDPKPLRHLDPTVPVELDRIAFKCLAKRMVDRYATASDVAANLQVVLQALEREHSQQTHSNDGSPGAAVAAEARPAATPLLPPVVPKGLRNFDRQDAEFFLRLLPGPKDLQGVPESLRFWLSTINASDPLATFPIGLLYGPSGGGKTSFVKAGLLPLLADRIIPIFVEATRDESELRLLKALRAAVPGIPGELSLPDILAGLRERQWQRPDAKILIILDQFEQWLHSNSAYETTQLVDALRQCDGEHVQAIVLIRDEFWMQVTRFFRILEVPLAEGRNSAAVDLFSVAHATAVLGEFGRAYGRLPELPNEWSAEQQRFLDLCAHGLADGEHVVPVRLALFAEMIKSKPWSRRTLPAARSSERLGVDFLDETFDSATAAPEHRLHHMAARRILEHLLPQEGSNIRGNIRTEQQLLEYSGYERTPHEFRQVIDILDRELRLITPTSLSGEAGWQGSDSQSHPGPSRCFQLTHDYLVPAIRAWLTRRRRETARGRAELRLADRASAYRDQPHSRQLPALWEWLSILTLTRPRDRNESEQRLVAAANRYHLARLTIAAALAMVVIGIVRETVGRTRATGFVSALATATTADVPGIVEEMAPYRASASSRLHELHEQGDHKARLHAAMALLPDSPATFDFLLHELLHAEHDTFAAIRDILAQYGNLDAARKRLWATLEDADQPADERFRAGMALADLANGSSDERWQAWASFLSAQLTDDLAQSPSRFEAWVNALRPKRQFLLADLRQVSRDTERSEAARHMAASALANFFADDRPVMEELLLEADGPQIVTFLAGLSPHRDGAREAMLRALATNVAGSPEDAQDLLAARSDYQAALQNSGGEPTSAANTALAGAGENLRRAAAAFERACDHRARRVANASVALFAWDTHTDALRPLLVHGPDPRLRSYLIDRVGRYATDSLDAGGAIELLHVAQADADVLQAHILLFGQAPSKLDRSVQSALSDELLAIYRSHPDSGVHSAAEWTLKQFGLAQRLEAIDVELAAEGMQDNRDWYLTPSGHTMIIIAPPERVKLGSPDEEPDRDTDEPEYWSQVPRRFAISAREVSQAQYLAYRRDFKHAPNEVAPTAECPINAVHWYNAASYCRWLSTKDHLPEDQMCYPPFVRQGFRPFDDYLKRTGYRLPTEAEWELAARAGAGTRFHYGNDAELLGCYDWHLANADGKTHPVGELMPNRLGLYDMHGNVSEWCFDGYRATRPAETVDAEDTTPLSNDEPRAVRGGSYAAAASAHRSANRRGDYPGTGSLQIGFRIVRTLSSHTTAGPPP